MKHCSSILMTVALSVLMIAGGTEAVADKTLDILIDGGGTPDTGGTVTAQPPGNTYSQGTTIVYSDGTQVTLTPNPAEGWEFSHWTITQTLPPTKATNPNPLYAEENVDVNRDLSWTAGQYVTSHNVFLGEATLDPPFVGSLPVGTETYDPGQMDYDTWHYWRIDEVGDGGTITGDLWGFKTAKKSGCGTVPMRLEKVDSGSIAPAVIPIVLAALALVAWAIWGRKHIKKEHVAVLALMIGLSGAGICDADTSYDNPLVITMNANTVVTAHFIQTVDVTVNVVGQGSYSIDPAGPYQTNDTITITFSPSAGQQMVTKPDVAPAAQGDPNAGWCFSHWTYSATPAESLGSPWNGLDNPATFTLTGDLTLYAHFLNNGTTCHPTANQESQLMDIARNTWSGFDALTTNQASQMYVKAEGWNDIIRDKHIKWGQMSTMWFKDFERTMYHYYDFLGEGMAWSGMYLAALSLKHSQMPTDQQTITDMNTLLDAMDRNTVIQGAPGYVARYSGLTSDPIYQAYYQNYGPGSYTGSAPYTDYTWLAHPTRDTMTGICVGLAAVLQYCQDTATLNKAKTIAERVVDRMDADSFWVRDIQGSAELPNANLTQLVKRVGYKANPTKYSGYYGDITGFTHLSLSTKTLYASDYWTAWMGWTQMWAIATLEWDATRIANYKEDFQSAYASLYLHMNTLYAAATTSFPSPDLEPWVTATHQGNLLSAADGVKWTWEVDLHSDPRFTYRDSTYVNEAALPNQRYHVDFDPQRSAAVAQGGYNYYAYCHTNVDLIWAYWAGRVSGAIPAP